VRLDFFVLADAANVADGKIYIHGGGLTRFNVLQFPSPMPQVAAVARFIVEDDDLGRPQPVTIDWRGPGGGVFQGVTGEVLVEAIGRAEGEDRGVVLVAVFGGSPLEQPGRYEARLIMSGDEQGAVVRPVVAVLISSGQPLGSGEQ
jgi:hypothetical protein